MDDHKEVVVITTRLTSQDKKELDRKARVEGINNSHYMREAISRYVQEYGLCHLIEASKQERAEYPRKESDYFKGQKDIPQISVKLDAECFGQLCQVCTHLQASAAHALRVCILEALHPAED